MGRAKKNVEVEAQVIARGNVVPMMTETESEETVQYVSDEDAAREDRLVSEIRMITEQTKQVVLFNSIEIGRRLTEAKAMVKRGTWGTWLKERVDYSQRTANNFMKIYQEYGRNGLAEKSQALALEFGAVLFYSTLSATDQKSISIERAFQAMREDGAVSGTAVLTDIDPGCRAELNGFKPYLDTRIEVFNGQNGQKNVLAEAGKALSSGSLSAICDDYGMDYAVLNYGINDVGIQDLKESGFKPIYSDNLTVCLKRSTV